MTQPMSAAAYRAHAAQVEAQKPTEIVTLKSGAVFELKRPDLAGFMATGRIPQSLVHDCISVWRKQGKVPGEGLSTSDQSTVEALITMREVVHDACVNPKFVEYATADDEIGAADMLPADFFEIFQWAMQHQGVAGLDGLNTFPVGRERASVIGGINRKKQRSPRKQSLAHR